MKNLANGKLLLQPKDNSYIDGPGVEVNRFAAFCNVGIVRIVFGEQMLPESNATFRCAVTMRIEAAAAFHKMLGDFLAEILKQEAEKIEKIDLTNKRS